MTVEKKVTVLNLNEGHRCWSSIHAQRDGGGDSGRGSVSGWSGNNALIEKALAYSFGVKQNGACLKYEILEWKDDICIWDGMKSQKY